jgi:hypothetical protein
MIAFTAYDDDGVITNFGVCQVGDFALQGKNVIEGNPPGLDFYVSQDGNFVSFGTPSSQFHSFDAKTKSWTVTSDGVARLIRRRNEALAVTDWTQLPDVPLETKTQWATYRQELRDVTDQPGYPYDIVWPTPPTA